MKTNRTHTTNELSKTFGVSGRYIQKLAKELSIQKTKGKYLFSENDIKRIKKELTNEPPTNHPPTAETITEEFSIQEYEKLQDVISDYQIKLKEVKHLLDQLKYMESQIEYFKTSLDKKDLQMNKLIESFQAVIRTQSEANHLQYLDKTKDKD